MARHQESTKETLRKHQDDDVCLGKKKKMARHKESTKETLRKHQDDDVCLGKKKWLMLPDVTTNWRRRKMDQFCCEGVAKSMTECSTENALEVTVDVLGYLKNFPNKRYVASRSNKA
jgi:hypothetical protein